MPLEQGQQQAVVEGLGVKQPEDYSLDDLALVKIDLQALPKIMLERLFPNGSRNPEVEKLIALKLNPSEGAIIDSSGVVVTPDEAQASPLQEFAGGGQR